MKKVNKQALLEVDEEVLSQFRREQVKFKNGEDNQTTCSGGAPWWR